MTKGKTIKEKKASRATLPDKFNKHRSTTSKRIGGLKMKKSFNQIAAQLERIYKLYYKGFGTEKLLEKAEKCMFGIQNVGLCF